MPSLIAADASIFFCFLSTFARIRLEAALILGAVVFFLASSSYSSSAFCYRYLFFSSNFFCSSKNLFNSRSFYSSSAFNSSLICSGNEILTGVTSTTATLGARLFLVINLGANVQPSSSFSSRAALAYYSRLSCRRRLSSMSIYTRLKSTFLSLSAAKL